MDEPAAAFVLPPARRDRPPVAPACAVRRRIVALRKHNLSVPDIKACLDAASEQAPSERTIDRVLKEEGFARLPRRIQAERLFGPAIF